LIASKSDAAKMTITNTFNSVPQKLAGVFFDLARRMIVILVYMPHITAK
jgi:hypothetical protein